jgi:uncharacterized protein YqgQ
MVKKLFGIMSLVGDRIYGKTFIDSVLPSMYYNLSMGKQGSKIVLAKAILKDQIRIESELTKIITRIVDELINEERKLASDLNGSDYSFLDDSISKFAWQAELKIQIKQVRKVKESVLKILKGSTNKMILATLEVSERIN